MKKVLLSIVLVPILILLFAFPSFALEEGSTAPDFEIPNLEGQKVRLSDFKGKIIILKLATTWCPTCKQQREAIREVESFLKEKGAVVVEVFLQDSEEMIREHTRKGELSVDHAVLLDNGKAAKAYNVYVIPRVLVIDRDFKIRRDGSLITGYDLSRTIKRILGES